MIIDRNIKKTVIRYHFKIVEGEQVTTGAVCMAFTCGTSPGDNVH